MFGLLALLFLAVPIIELYVIVKVAGGIGVLETLGLLILISIVGAWLVRAQGLGILDRLRAQLARGAMPTNELVDGGLVLFAGALMLTPGFVTDAVGLLLLFPPTRIPVRTFLKRRFRRRTTIIGFAGDPRSGIYDVDVVDLERDDEGPWVDPPGELSE